MAWLQVDNDIVGSVPRSSCCTEVVYNPQSHVVLIQNIVGVIQRLAGHAQILCSIAKVPEVASGISDGPVGITTACSVKVDREWTDPCMGETSDGRGICDSLIATEPGGDTRNNLASRISEEYVGYRELLGSGRLVKKLKLDVGKKSLCRNRHRGRGLNKSEEDQNLANAPGRGDAEATEGIIGIY